MIKQNPSLEKYKGIGFDNFDKVVEDNFKSELREVAYNTLEKKGICCFSEDKYNVLMWSHYSDKHRGFCLRI